MVKYKIRFYGGNILADKLVKADDFLNNLEVTSEGKETWTCFYDGEEEVFRARLKDIESIHRIEVEENDG